MPLTLLSRAEQVAAHLRAELMTGRWTGALPGILALGKDLGVNHNTIAAALELLEAEGLLVSQGHGRPRRIVLPKGKVQAPALRIQILPYEKQDRAENVSIELMNRLDSAGFAADFAPKTQHELGMNAKRVARLVAATPGDAWVIYAGSREVLEWFAHQPIPAIAMFGRFVGLPIAAASPRKAPAFMAATRRLIELGHRRIVMLAREERRKPKPALVEQLFLDELAAHGITPGPYNLPDWEDHPAGFHACLDALFRHTPPTALIIVEPKLFTAAQQHLARKGIVAPEQVSLVCDDPDPTFTWCDPPVSHIRWDSRPVVNRVVRWAGNIARGRDDRRQSFATAEFIEGGTIGPVKGVGP